MAFAAQSTRQTGEACGLLAQKTEHTALRQALETLSAEGVKNLALIEETRRLNVTEMILEPITGLREEEYRVGPMEAPAGSRAADLVKAALVYEERDRRFFQDASDKVPLPEVARFFRKMAKRKERNILLLRSLGEATDDTGSV